MEGDVQRQFSVWLFSVTCVCAGVGHLATLAHERFFTWLVIWRFFANKGTNSRILKRWVFCCFDCLKVSVKPVCIFEFIILFKAILRLSQLPRDDRKLFYIFLSLLLFFYFSYLWFDLCISHSVFFLFLLSSCWRFLVLTLLLLVATV